MDEISKVFREALLGRLDHTNGSDGPQKKRYELTLAANSKLLKYMT
jgi:hypothetical protein